MATRRRPSRSAKSRSRSTPPRRPSARASARARPRSQGRKSLTHGPRKKAAGRAVAVHARRATAKRATPSASRPRAVVDLLEDLQAEFEEAGAHVAQQSEFRSLRLTPARLLGLERVVAGAVGWGAELRVAPDPLEATSHNGGDRSAGWVYLIVRPSAVAKRSSEEADSPLQGLNWDELTYAEECRGIPNSMIAATSSDEATEPLLRRFAEGLRSELEIG